MARVVTINGVGDIDLDKIAKLLPGRNGWDILQLGTQGRYIKAIIDSWPVLEEHEINTPLRLGHFFGQGIVETGFFKSVSENLNYTSKRLLEVWPKRYAKKPELVKIHAGNPEALAEYVYGNRPKMENTNPGDGFKYRGRGFIQLTGKKNYRIFGDLTGLPLVDDPDIISKDLTKSVLVAAAFWRENGLNTFADQDNSSKISRAINIGNPESTVLAHAEDTRAIWTRTALSITQAPETVAPSNPGPSRPPPAAPSLKPLRLGASGAAVRELQSDLEALGFATGGVDGIFGRGTRRGVTAFQDEAGLPVTGEADDATRAAIDAKLEEPERARELAINRADPRTFGPPAT